MIEIGNHAAPIALANGRDCRIQLIAKLQVFSRVLYVY